MDTVELVQKLSDTREMKAIDQPEENSAEEKFLLISIKDQKYAFFAEQVKEIAFNSELFYIPFVPLYVRGYINRHGEPFTVLDLRVLFSNETLDSSKFLIMSIENDQVSFMITDILEFIKVDKKDIRKITSEGEVNKFFSGSFSIKDSEVFIINTQNVLERLENDL
jgi:chemotaxis signal transduction protein